MPPERWMLKLIVGAATCLMRSGRIFYSCKAVLIGWPLIDMRVRCNRHEYQREQRGQHQGQDGTQPGVDQSISRR